MNSSMLGPEQYLQQAELIYSADDVSAAIQQMAAAIRGPFADTQPLVLCVMGGAVFFAGQLLPLLDFPLEFDYVQASRYHSGTSGQHLVGRFPGKRAGRTVLLLDDSGRVIRWPQSG